MTATTTRHEKLVDLATLIHESDTFFDALDQWCGARVELDQPTRGNVQLTADQAVQLEVGRHRDRPDTLDAADVRRHLVADSRTAIVRREVRAVAEVASLVLRRRIPVTVLEELDHTRAPLGRLLKPYGLVRHTHSVRQVWADCGDQAPLDHVPALQITGRLDLHTGPVALTTETVLLSALKETR